MKSTVPVGFTDSIAEKYSNQNILFSPDFSREGRALYDNLYPSRIIVGCPADERLREAAKTFARLLVEGATKEDIDVLYMERAEVETVKLFANTYLALQVSYINELDTFAEMHGLQSKNIIEGIASDMRIGDHYNNPSFGYDGFSLAKNKKQAWINHNQIPFVLTNAAVKINKMRKAYVAERILELVEAAEAVDVVVGIFKVVRKPETDNICHSTVIDVMEHIKAEGVEVVIYEPTFAGDSFYNSRVVKDIEEFKGMCDVIVANRYSEELEDVVEKVYTRDLYFRD